MTSQPRLNVGPRQEGADVAARTPGSVCAVTVTYGDRWHLLRQILKALLDEKFIWKVILVSNGCSWDVQGLAGELEPERIEVLDLKSNRGSAAGFAAGIKRACELGTDFIWLLDDDNEPQSGALAELLAAHTRLGKDFPDNNLAVLGFRPKHPPDAAAGMTLSQIKWPSSAFWGFHLLDLPHKLWRRTPWGRPLVRRALPPLVEMTHGPSGGLLFHRAVVEKHGLPRADFVLYGEDTEFTYRITSGGGALRLVTSAEIDDLDASWHMHGGFATTLHTWLKSGSDVRAFYGARNLTYIESHCFPRNKFMYSINRRIYCSALWLLAMASRRAGRYMLLESAIRDGLAGRLGEVSRFHL